MSHEAFHYHRLATEVRSPVEEHAKAIKAMIGRMGFIAEEVGRRLIDTKRLLPHGEFIPWVEKEFGWTARNAQDYMAAARLQADMQARGEMREPFAFGISVLRLIARSTTPEAAREEIIERDGAGEKITETLAAEIIERHREEDPADDEPAEDEPAPPSGTTGPRPSSGKAPAPPRDDRLKRLHAAKVHLDKAHRELDGLGGEGEGPLGHVEMAQTELAALLGD